LVCTNIKCSVRSSCATNWPESGRKAVVSKSLSSECTLSTKLW